MTDPRLDGPTPGPWEACDPGDYGDFDGNSRVILGDDMRIAVVHRHPSINTAQSDANARLIAAAPDGLEFAKWIAYHWENQDMSHETFRVEAFRRAEAFITRARGKDHG